MRTPGGASARAAMSTLAASAVPPWVASPQGTAAPMEAGAGGKVAVAAARWSCCDHIDPLALCPVTRIMNRA